MVKVRVFIFLALLIALPFSKLISCAGTGVVLIAVLLNPLCVQDVNPGDPAIQFNACIFIDGVRQPGFENDAVTWSVLGGDVNGTITQAGLFTIPNTDPPAVAQVIIIATSKEDTQKQGQAVIIYTGNGSCDTFPASPDNPECL